jgi:acyl carrier protein
MVVRSNWRAGIDGVFEAMDAHRLKLEIKELIVKELNLEGRDPSSIDDEAPLFGEGLGLDSLDALQLAMSIEERFGVRIPEGEAAKPIFRSVASLAEHVVRSKAA